MYEDIPDNHNSSLPPICKFLKKSGWCQFGENCRFRHDLTSIPTQTDRQSLQRGGRGRGPRQRGGGTAPCGRGGEQQTEKQEPRQVNQTRDDADRRQAYVENRGRNEVNSAQHGGHARGFSRRNDQRQPPQRNEDDQDLPQRNEGRYQHSRRNEDQHSRRNEDYQPPPQRNEDYMQTSQHGGHRQPSQRNENYRQPSQRNDHHRQRIQRNVDNFVPREETHRREYAPVEGERGRGRGHSRGSYEPRNRGINFQRHHLKDDQHDLEQRDSDYNHSRGFHQNRRNIGGRGGYRGERRAEGRKQSRGGGSGGGGRGHRGHLQREYTAENATESETESMTEMEAASQAPVNEEKVSHGPAHVSNSENVIHPQTSQEDDQRETEIRQLLRRFPKTIPNQNGLDFELDFNSSDPDWPYDVNTIGLNIHLPRNYPQASMKVTVPEMSPSNLPVPEVLRQYTEKEIQNWVGVRFSAMMDNGQTELAVRPFCRWLDRNMETIFTEGLVRTKREIANQASGFVFIRNEADEEKGSTNSSTDDDTDDDLKDEGDEEGGNDDDGEDGDDDGDEDDEWTDEEDINGAMEDLSIAEKNAETLQNNDNPTSSSSAAKGGAGADSTPARKGTEMKLVNMELGENVSLLRLVGLALVAQCSKCKKKVDVALGPGRTQSKTCEKCRTIMTVQFRPAIVHVHSPVIGFLDIFGAIPFDLVTINSKFSLECLNCNRGQAPSGLHASKSGNSTFCTQCHARLHVAFSSVKFTALVPNEAFVPKTTTSAKQEKKKAISMGIREGYPLPQSGACQHYKKSFRWFRFSCCNRIFPCDRCHEEEVKDHEPDFAPKMICGHCSKEQPFHKEKACISCGESTTRPRTSHWEGGKGCRNKLKMASTDKQKYRNCNKTLSRKEKEKLDAAKPGNDKKETKLRHS